MKTTRIASLFAATLSLVLAASAAPASKRSGPSTSNGSSGSSATADHSVMKRVGPAGKGYTCPH